MNTRALGTVISTGTARGRTASYIYEIQMFAAVDLADAGTHVGAAHCVCVCSTAADEEIAE